MPFVRLIFDKNSTNLTQNQDFLSSYFQWYFIDMYHASKNYQYNKYCINKSHWYAALLGRVQNAQYSYIDINHIDRLILTLWVKDSVFVWRPQTSNLTRTTLYEHMIGFEVSCKEKDHFMTGWQNKGPVPWWSLLAPYYFIQVNATHLKIMTTVSARLQYLHCLHTADNIIFPLFNCSVVQWRPFIARFIITNIL